MTAKRMGCAFLFITMLAATALILFYIPLGPSLGSVAASRPQARSLMTATSESTATAGQQIQPLAPSVSSRPLTIVRQQTRLLALGIDEEGEAEVIYLLTVDYDSKDYKIDAYPPSLQINVRDTAGNTTQKELRAVYFDALQQTKGDKVTATRTVAQALSDTFGIEPTNYATVQEKSLAVMVDALGGIDVDVPVEFAGIPAGKQHLNGTQTWLYVSKIDVHNINAETMRISRQKNVLMGLQARLVSLNTIGKIPGLLSQFVDDQAMITDLSADNILALIDILKNSDRTSPTFNIQTQ